MDNKQAEEINNKLVTIAIPLYNTEKYVERAILSALNQTYSNIEFLLIDDKGTDNTVDVVKFIIANHPRKDAVRIVEHPKNIGTGAVRNTGIDEAKGHYLYYMDSDDEITSDCIEKLYYEMSKIPVDFVGASHDLLREGEGRINGTQVHEYVHIKPETSMPIAKAHYTKKVNVSVHPWNKLFSISFLRENNIRCIPNHINEDELFAFQILIKAKSCKLIEDITYHHYIVDGSTMVPVSLDEKGVSRRIEQYKEIMNTKKELWSQYYKKTDIAEAVFDAIMAQVWGYVFFIFAHKNKMDWSYGKKSIRTLLDTSFLDNPKENNTYKKWYRRSKLPFVLLFIYYYRYTKLIKGRG